MAKKRHIRATMRVDRFVPANDDDGPFEGEDLTTPSPAVALHFDFDRELIALLKNILQKARLSRSRKGRPLSVIPEAGGWSAVSRCWWVRSTFWIEVREALLGKDIKLIGPLARPAKRKTLFFEHEQVWNDETCAWEWPEGS